MGKSADLNRANRAATSPPSPAKARKRSAAERFPAKEIAKTAKGDPFPTFVEPCLATLVDKVPTGDRWLHEIKWDGYRLLVRVENGKVTILTRRGHDWTDRFPTIRDAAKDLPVTAGLIDGEAVVEVEGVANFSALQAALGAREGPGHKAAHEAVFYAFDLLHLDGTDLTRTPLTKRKEALAPLVGGSPGAIRYSEHMAEGEALFKHACIMGLEGVVSKRTDRPYRSGRNDDWLKIKCTLRQEFIVAGYLNRSDNPRSVGALVLGAYGDGKLAYIGRVGTGFTSNVARDLWKQLQPLRTATPTFAEKLPTLARKGVVWVKPELVAEVEYRGWTSDELLRHASFQGLREDKDARDVVKERAVPVSAPEPEPPRSVKAPPASKAARFRPANIQTLYPDAVVPADDQLTAYWRAVGDEALKYLGRRPLKLVRHVRGKTFMHQGPLPPVPEAVHQLRIEKATGEEGVRVWVDSIDGLVALARDMDVVEIHPWGASIDDVEHPDMLVIDIDPGEGVEWEFVTETALKLRDVFKGEGIASWPKVSGSKGIHVMAPVAPDLDWESARAYCKSIAERVAATAARRYTTSARQNRTGRIFLDYLRNVPSIAAVGTYSPRAKPGFPVAMRITWRDVENGAGPDAFTMASLIAGRPRKRK